MVKRDCCISDQMGWVAYVGTRVTRMSIGFSNVKPYLGAEDLRKFLFPKSVANATIALLAVILGVLVEGERSLRLPPEILYFSSSLMDVAIEEQTGLRCDPYLSSESIRRVPQPRRSE